MRSVLIVLSIAAGLLVSTTTFAARPAESKAGKGEPKPADAEEYLVVPGDTLLSIALRHGLTLSVLLEANGLEDANKVNAGQKLLVPRPSKWGKVTKAGVVIEVPKGFSLHRIADAYNVKPRELLKANKLANPNKLRAGQKLLIPGAKAAIELVPPPPCYKPKVTLYRVRTDDASTLPLCFCDGRPTPAAIEAISRLSAAPDAPLRQLNPRLVELLQAVADQFPDTRIELISGFRSARQKDSESRHTTGDAIDFRLLGVSNKTLSETLRRLSNVGVGFYPNSVFVHLDSRETSAYWIDYSRPGEKAIYGPGDMSQEELASIRDRRRLPIAEQLAAATVDAALSIAKAVEKATETIDAPAVGDDNDEDRPQPPATDDTPAGS